MKKYIICCIMAIVCLTACDTQIERVFKQHLYSELLNAQSIHDEAEEGQEEGQYIVGSKAALQTVLDEGYAIYYNQDATQQEVDDYCATITDAVAEFKVSINPILSNLREMLVQAAELIETARENNIPQQQIDELEKLIAEVMAALNDTSRRLTQPEVSDMETRLSTLMSDIEAQIPGAINVRIENPSFEPLNLTDEVITDFSMVPGWNNAGLVSGVTPWDGLLTNSLISKYHWIVSGKSVDQNYALYVQTYSQQVYQTLNEKVRDNCTYTVSVRAMRDQWKDAEKTKLQLQLVSFEEGTTTFSKATVLAEQEFNNIATADFTEYEMVYSPAVNPDNVGKQITVCVRCYYNKPSETSAELVWQDAGVAVDNIKLIREKN